MKTIGKVLMVLILFISNMAMAASSLSPTPAEVSAKLSELFLTTDPDLYKPIGYKAPKAYGGGQLIHYSVVSLWVNALECARLSNNSELEKRLVAAFEPAYNEKKIWMNNYRHVDLSIVGAIAIEIYILTGDERAKALGLRYADRQWEEPKEDCDWGDKWYEKITLEERRENWGKGYSPETRLWIDDMYMISVLQGLAYRATNDRKYIERSAKEMCLYLKRLQREDGLFNHAPSAPFAWGRGNGWMAAAMAMNLALLPKDSEWREPILADYIKMMKALKEKQRPNGLWGQIVDDEESYDETSASAMFAYAFAEGAKAGVLDDEYLAAAKRAYNALVARLDEYGNISDVCVGTGWKNDRHHYLTRPRANGDPHGQAPLLWLCKALL
ncbi:MAG: glycoside hydrolase family 88 protein [Kiritimatiellae bacterium]|nr:glycoside hydrolase family 88 protein [Kiritimatiellia bacterium]